MSAAAPARQAAPACPGLGPALDDNDNRRVIAALRYLQP